MCILIHYGLNGIYYENYMCVVHTLAKKKRPYDDRPIKRRQLFTAAGKHR